MKEKKGEKDLLEMLAESPEEYGEQESLKGVFKRLNQRPIAYYPVYAEIMGGVAGGILLSQIMYWWSAQGEGGDEFWKKDEELIQETRLSERELKKAKRKLKQLNFITLTVRGVPPTTHYKVNFKELVLALRNPKNVRTKSDDGVPFKSDDADRIESDDGVRLINTETTTETTTEKYISSSLSKPSKSKLDRTPVQNGNPSIKEKIKAKAKAEPKPKPEPEYEYERIISYLNRKTNKAFRATTKKTMGLIKARYEEGFATEDFKKVIDIKCKEWLDDPEWDKFLRPQTLFSGNFEAYLNQKDKFVQILPLED